MRELDIINNKSLVETIVSNEIKTDIYNINEKTIKMNNLIKSIIKLFVSSILTIFCFIIFMINKKIILLILILFGIGFFIQNCLNIMLIDRNYKNVNHDKLIQIENRLKNFYKIYYIIFVIFFIIYTYYIYIKDNDIISPLVMTPFLLYIFFIIKNNLFK